jgi:Cu(I)/Ag(I) efflux system membrane fusion protein
MFEPRDVQIGARVGDLLQVLSGLAAGERVATSGGYLIDSEAQLQGGDAASHAGHGTATAPPPAQHPKKDQLDMGDMKM